jgi:hypothetical protein
VTAEDRRPQTENRRPKTGPELWLALRILGLLILIRLLIRLVKLETLLRWLTRDSSRLPAPGARLGPSCRAPGAGSWEPDWEKAARYTDAFLRRMSFPLPGQCLPRALTLHYLARRSGLPVQFHCGVRRDGDRLQGHAWLTLHGQPFLEPQDPEGTFAVTFTFPASPAHP